MSESGEGAKTEPALEVLKTRRKEFTPEHGREAWKAEAVRQTGAARGTR